MPKIKGTARQANSREQVTEGGDVYLQLLRNGAAVGADWKQAAIMAGYGFIVNVGAFSLGIVGGGAGTVLDLDEPEFILSIPNGIAVLPISIGVHVQSGAPADAEEVEILVAVDQDKELDGTSKSGSTYTTETAYNLNTVCGKGTSCGCYSAFTDTVTDPVLDLELARKVVEYDGGATHSVTPCVLDLVYEPTNPPVINGPAQLIIYWGGDTATVGGFAEVQWLEFPESAFSV